MNTPRVLLFCAFLTLSPSSLYASASAATVAASENSAGSYHLDAGPFTPAEAELTLHDAVRDVDLQIRVRYPKDAKAPVPLVIFSHGMGGSSDVFAVTTAHWASYGYVVILPTHADSLSLQDKAAKREFVTNTRAYVKRVDPVGRVDDVKMILDSLDEIEKQVPGLKLAGGGSVIDAERVGMSGHSAGALTTQMAIGVAVRTKDNIKPHGVGDARIDCGIVISGQGTSNRMFTGDSWSGLTTPMLVITGSEDLAGPTNETPETRQHPYVYAPAGDKYLLFIEGATHSSYGGKTQRGKLVRRLTKQEEPENLELIGDAVTSQTLAFWDAYLKDSPDAKAYLAADAINALDPAVKAEHK